MTHITLNQWGLLFDLMGVLLLFRYGLPSEIESEKGPSLAIGADQKEQERIRKKNKTIKIGAFAGLTLVFLGFLLQFLGSAR